MCTYDRGAYCGRGPFESRLGSNNPHRAMTDEASSAGGDDLLDLELASLFQRGTYDLPSNVDCAKRRLWWRSRLLRVLNARCR